MKAENEIVTNDSDDYDDKIIRSVGIMASALACHARLQMGSTPIRSAK